MKPVNYAIRLDVGKPGSQAAINVKEGDIGTREIAVTLYHQSLPLSVDDTMTVVLRAIKPDVTLVYDDCTVENNVIKRVLSPQMLVVRGVVKCEIAIYSSENELLYSPWFEIYVGDKLYSDGVIESTNEFSALTEAMTSVKNLENAVATAENGRVEAEDGRVEAEAGRDALYEQIKGDYESGAFKGDKGDTANGLTIMGRFATAEELEAAITDPEIGDAYEVGTAIPYDVYIYIQVDGETRWDNGGPYQGPKGEDGQDGTDGDDGVDGIGVPTGGAAGQVLAKASAGDFDTEWTDQTGGSGHGVPAGGQAGEVLTKISDANYDAEWRAGLGVIDSGSNENGTWIKMADGTLICTKEITRTDVTFTQSGSSGMYFSPAVTIGDWAHEFIDTPIVEGSVSNASTQNVWVSFANNYNLAYAGRHTAATGVTIRYCFFAIGRWTDEPSPFPLNTHYDVQSGSNDNGTWIKFPDGTMICTKRINLTGINLTAASGNVYTHTGSGMLIGDFAQSFIDDPITNIEVKAFTSSWAGSVTAQGVENRFFIFSATSKTDVSATVDITAIGRWATKDENYEPDTLNVPLYTIKNVSAGYNPIPATTWTDLEFKNNEFKSGVNDLFTVDSSGVTFTANYTGKFLINVRARTANIATAGILHLAMVKNSVADSIHYDTCYSGTGQGAVLSYTGVFQLNVGDIIKFQGHSLVGAINFTDRGGVIEFVKLDTLVDIQANKMLNMIYPVGSIYMSVNDVNPATIFGGTWEQWGNGRVPVGVADSGTFNTVEKTGGAETVLLTYKNAPAEAAINWSAAVTNARSVRGTVGDVTAYSANFIRHVDIETTTPVNNLQPYITCYMWKRTA